MHENGDDNMLIDDVFEDENMEEWSWVNIKSY
jgi:antitoxin MazE